MVRILLWTGLAVAVLAGLVIALALAPKVAVLVIVVVAVVAAAIRIAVWIRFRGTPQGRPDVRDQDIARDATMQTFQRDKARTTGPGP